MGAPGTGWKATNWRYMRRSLRKLVVLASILALLGATLPVAAADHDSRRCERRNNNSISKLLECVDVRGVREHQRAFQEIADENGGTRVSGTPGYDESAEYVARKMRRAGYDVTVQEFDYQAFINLAPPLLEQIAPAPGGPITNFIASYSGSGDVTGPVSLPTGDFRGCDASDFDGFPSGSIALISRGAPPGFPVACTFGLKATNAFDAGAIGVVIYNNVPGTPAFTLGNTFTLNIPVTGVTLEVGTQLADLADNEGGLTLHLVTETFRGVATTSNVFAEKEGRNEDNVVMAGAHLDSVDAGPGINDNGSGSGALLEVAEQMAKVKTRNTVRFAWWGAEEANLVGSTHYVTGLTPEELDEIALYLNFDMVGSPNHVFFIYDGDDSDAVGAPAGPPGSDLIEQKFERFFDKRDIPYKGTDFTGRSDYGPFIAAGIPSGGLFTGAEGIKTAEEAEIWGGTAGEQYDQCYHAVCDTIDNVNRKALDVNSDAIAYVTFSYAMSTRELDDVVAPAATLRSQQAPEDQDAPAAA
jgi:Zn-dependent M28 family amino/carboxypeptidase